MLTLRIGEREFFDETKEEFTTQWDYELELEHSLATLSKWESIHEKPFLGEEEHTDAEMFSYIEIMIQTPDYPADVCSQLTQSNIEAIQTYIEAKRTATWFHDSNEPNRTTEKVTSELVYYWMVALNIPFEAQDWHLNRLMTLIRVCNVKNSPPKKMSQSEIAARNRRLNEERKKKMGTSG